VTARVIVALARVASSPMVATWVAASTSAWWAGVAIAVAGVAASRSGVAGSGSQTAGPGAAEPLGRAVRRRVARRYAVAALGLALAAAGYSAWQWHAHQAAEIATRLIAEGRYKPAIRVLQRRLAAAPGDARLHYSLGLAYARLGVVDGAINQLSQAVRLAPRQALYHAALGQAYRDAGGVEQASRALEEAVRLDPTEPRYEASLAGLQLELGRLDPAIAGLRDAATRHPGELGLHLLLAEALRQAGDRDGMTHEYQEVIRLAAEQPIGEAARQELRAALSNVAPPRGSHAAPRRGE
jgi:predicted Zn-dependent protease